MLKVAIVGYGNIGKYALDALMLAQDMECVGVVRRNPAEGLNCAESKGTTEEQARDIPVSADISDFGKVDVAILSTPSRKVQENAEKYLKMGISTVDSFDIHTGIWDLRCALDKVAKENGVASIISAGWDPGTDSVVRALMQGMVPEGVTYTNFGPGRSMGHSVAAKAIPGVRDALSMTLPAGKGVHDRHVYIELEDGADFETVSAAIKSDPYFVHDKTVVEKVESVAAVNTLMHGVKLERFGKSGCTDGQTMDFNMRINNPALTGQVLVMAARAAARQKPGCYTMIEVPVIDYLPGDRETLVKSLV